MSTHSPGGLSIGTGTAPSPGVGGVLTVTGEALRVDPVTELGTSPAAVKPNSADAPGGREVAQEGAETQPSPSKIPFHVSTIAGPVSKQKIQGSKTSLPVFVSTKVPE